MNPMGQRLIRVIQKDFPSVSLFCTGLCEFFPLSPLSSIWVGQKNGFRAHPWLCRAGVIKRRREGQVEGSSESDK